MLRGIMPCAATRIGSPSADLDTRAFGRPGARVLPHGFPVPPISKRRLKPATRPSGEFGKTTAAGALARRMMPRIDRPAKTARAARKRRAVCQRMENRRAARLDGRWSRMPGHQAGLLIPDRARRIPAKNIPNRQTTLRLEEPCPLLVQHASTRFRGAAARRNATAAESRRSAAISTARTAPVSECR